MTRTIITSKFFDMCAKNKMLLTIVMMCSVECGVVACSNIPGLSSLPRVLFLHESTLSTSSGRLRSIFFEVSLSQFFGPGLTSSYFLEALFCLIPTPSENFRFFQSRQFPVAQTCHAAPFPVLIRKQCREKCPLPFSQ